jgi:hypothetical protein
MTTFFAPPSRCPWAFSTVVKTPLDSTMYSAPVSRQGILAGSFSWYILIVFPLTMRFPDSSDDTFPLKMPCVESYLSIYEAYLGSMNGSLTATMPTPSWSMLGHINSHVMVKQLNVINLRIAKDLEVGLKRLAAFLETVPGKQLQLGVQFVRSVRNHWVALDQCPSCIKA